MAIPLAPSSQPKPFTVPSVSNQVQAVFNQFFDTRQTATSNNLKYAVPDAAMSAGSVFFTPSPSFLDYQIRMPKKYGKNNAQSIFGRHQLPSAGQVRNLLDPVPPEMVYPLLMDRSDGRYYNGYLSAFRAIGDTRRMPIDDTNFFSSAKISGPGGTRQTLKNGKILYRHPAVTPIIVAPSSSDVIPLPPKFVPPPAGHEKPDGELAAAKRWLVSWGEHYSPWGITILGDDLSGHQPFGKVALEQGYQVLLVGKPDSPPLRYEWIADFERTGHLGTIERTRWNGKQRLTEPYRYLNPVPLRDSDDALMLNWCELTITDAQGQTI